MHYFYSPEELTINKSLYLSEEESLHCSQVLRLKKDENIGILNGLGYKSVATITDVLARSKIKVQILKVQKVQKQKVDIHLFLAPLKKIFLIS